MQREVLDSKAIAKVERPEKIRDLVQVFVAVVDGDRQRRGKALNGAPGAGQGNVAIGAPGSSGGGTVAGSGQDVEYES